MPTSESLGAAKRMAIPVATANAPRAARAAPLVRPATLAAWEGVALAIRHPSARCGKRDCLDLVPQHHEAVRPRATSNERHREEQHATAAFERTPRARAEH